MTIEALDAADNISLNINPKGNFIDHYIVQLSSIINGYREGGLFIMIGKKNRTHQK